MRQMNLSARAYHRILKLARTIADLAGSDRIQTGAYRGGDSVSAATDGVEAVQALFPDTGPEAEQVLINLLRHASVARKLEMLGQMNAAARQLALLGLRARHPRASEAQLQRYLADLLLGADLAARAYGPRPTEATHAA